MEQKLLENLQKLENIMATTGLNNEIDAIDYVLLHYSAFPQEFIQFCESYLKGEHFSGF